MISLCPAAYPIAGGMHMMSQDYWKLFEETGAPEMYLMYVGARNVENANACNDTSPGAAGCKLQ